MHEVLIIDTTRGENPKFNNELTDAVRECAFESAVISFSEAPDEVERIQAASGVIIAGVPFHYPAKSAEQLQPYLQSWLPDIRVPVLGICLGHQAVGLVFGATMRRAEEIEEGTIDAEVTREHMHDPIFAGLGNSFEVESFHWASIDIEDTSQLLKLASSAAKPKVSTGCQNQVVKVADRQIYGAQFHPEKSSTGKLFLRNFLELPRPA